MSWKKENLAFNFSEILSDLFADSAVWVQDIYIYIYIYIHTFVYVCFVRGTQIPGHLVACSTKFCRMVL